MRSSVNGLQVAYTDEGKGIPLLFVHGFPFARGIWSRQVAAFKANHRVLAPDLRGFGESQGTPGKVAMRTYADDLYALLQGLHAPPAILVGHSMGGYIAMAFANAYPEALRGLVLVGTKAGPDVPEVAEARRELAARVQTEGTSAVVSAMASKMLSARNHVADLAKSGKAMMGVAKPEGVISALLGMADRPDAGPWLKDVEARTLVMSGAMDDVIPPSEAGALMMAFPSAQLRLIPNAGHLVAYEQPDAFNETLRAWLAWGEDSND